MLYAGMVWLHLSEEQFWHMTTRKFFALLAVHKQMVSAQDPQRKDTSTVTDCCIDQIKGW